MRLFVALQLPDSWRQALGQLQDQMRDGLRQRFGDSLKLRWMSADGIHLTLKFLGETPPSRVSAIESALAKAVPPAPGFSLSLANVGLFADRRAPRVVLAGVSGDTKQLFALAEQVETWLAAAGWPRERRGFRPHLTLAHLPQTMDDEMRKTVAELTMSYRTAPVPDWTVERVGLIRSHLGPGGARYETLFSVPK